MNEIIQFENITKLFPGVVALDEVSFSISKGEVHAVVGQNGAGKSTLMNILAGEIQPDKGELIFNGDAITIPTPHAARQLGISVVYQELMLCPNLSILENVFLSQGRLKTKEKEDKLEELPIILADLGVNVPLNTKIGELSVAKQQLVEIAKAVSFKSEVLVLDEPTSSLTASEAKKLFEIIKKLKSEGTTIIFISHRLEEVFEIADRITVLKDGKYVATLEKDKVEPGQLINLMIGKELSEMFFYEPPQKELNNICLRVKNLSRAGLFQGINFELREGEILGVYGLQGAGRTELVETIFGLARADEGEVQVFGRPVKIESTEKAIEFGLAMIPEDRRRTGLFANMDVKDNINIVKAPQLTTHFGFLLTQSFVRVAQEFIKKLNIKTSGVFQLVKNLSGGNQQKVIVARWLAINPRIILMDEVTRGIDVGAKAEMYKIIHNLRKEGISILLISSELSEIIGICDRVVVMYKGRVVGDLERNEFSEEKILAYAMGIKQNQLSEEVV